MQLVASRTFWLISIVLTTALAAGQCALPDSEPPRPTTTDRKIFNGTNDTSQAHMAVVALTYGPGSGSFCTGTLIAPNVVLTAAHCVDGVSASWVEVFFGNSIAAGGDYRSVQDLNPHYNYDPSTNEGDIALIRLSSNAPSTITPIPALPATSGLTSNDVGLSADFSGFGLTELSTSDVKLHVSLPIDYVCNQATACQGWIAPYSFEYTQGSGGPCSGDSGGPAFIFRGGQEYVAGVTSYGDPQCTQYGVSTQVDAYISWINTYIGGVVPEDCGNGVDDDGDGLTDCADSDCSGDPSCQGPDACEAAGTITCGGQINGTTVGGPSDFSTYSCLSGGTESGPERAYELGAPAGTQVTAVMTPTGSGDLDLFLLPPQGASCNTAGCLDASINGSTNPEQIVFTMPAGGAFLVVETYDTASPFTLQLTCPQQPEVCNNNIDDDGDGAIDCADPDCANSPACQPDPEVCNNNIDDDGDGAIDCADPDCANSPACQPDPEICNNNIDDDGDGAIDCADPDCVNSLACQTGQELCTNGTDDDGDGAIDCGDPDCATAPNCQPNSEVCGNGIDDDGDGIVDCADPDCVHDLYCQAGQELCANGQDDDGDLNIDCADPDCATAPNCKPTHRGKGGCNCRQGGPGSWPVLPFVLVLLVLGIRLRRTRKPRPAKLVDSPSRPVPPF